MPLNQAFPLKSTMQYISHSLDSLNKHSIIQSKRDKASFKLRWRKIDMSSEHIPKVMGKTGCICPLRFSIIRHRCFCKVEAEHRTDTLKLRCKACIMKSFPYPLLQKLPLTLKL